MEKKKERKKNLGHEDSVIFVFVRDFCAFFWARKVFMMQRHRGERNYQRNCKENSRGHKKVDVKGWQVALLIDEFFFSNKNSNKQQVKCSQRMWEKIRMKEPVKGGMTERESKSKNSVKKLN